MRIPVIGSGVTGRSEVVTSHRFMNLYPQINKDARAVVACYGTPGLRRRVTLGSGPIRGMLKYLSTLYVVSGDRFYSVDTSFNSTLRGTLDTDEGMVFMATNGLVVLIVDGDKGWTYTISGATFAEVTDANFPTSPRSVTYADGYFLVNDSGTQRVHYSTTGTSWGASDFFSAEQDPDDLNGLITDHNEVILLGTNSSEVWRLTANGWTIIDGAFIEYGCIARGTPAKIDNSVFWLGNDLKVYRLDGYTPKRISNHEVEYVIAQNVNSVANARAFSYTQEGHSFYQLTINDTTMVYDAATGMWHERGYWNVDDGLFNRHRADCHALFKRLPIVGDYENGDIYEYDLDTYTDDGDEISSILTTRHLDAEGKRLFFQSFEAEMETGVGLQSGQGSDPQVELRWSNDGGRRWTNWVRRDFGAVGAYDTRARWFGLGSAADRVFELRVTDPVKRAIANLNLDVTVGR